jgi:hypothetical protein
MSGYLGKERFAIESLMCIILCSPLSPALRSLRFGAGDDLDFPFRACAPCFPLRVKGKCLTVPLGGLLGCFLLVADPMGEMIAWETQGISIISITSPALSLSSGDGPGY